MPGSDHKTYVSPADKLNEIVGDPCAVKSELEAKKLIKNLGLNHRDKVVAIKQMTRNHLDKTFYVDMRHRHSFMFTWEEKIPATEAQYVVYGMPRQIDRQMIEIRFIRCNSQRWFFRVTVGMRSQKILEVHHSTNGRPVTVPLSKMFGYTFTDQTTDSVEYGMPTYVTSDGYIITSTNKERLTKPIVKELKTYQNLLNYQKLVAL